MDEGEDLEQGQSVEEVEVEGEVVDLLQQKGNISG